MKRNRKLFSKIYVIFHFAEQEALHSFNKLQTVPIQHSEHEHHLSLNQPDKSKQILKIEF